MCATHTQKDRNGANGNGSVYTQRNLLSRRGIVSATAMRVVLLRTRTSTASGPLCCQFCSRKKMAVSASWIRVQSFVGLSQGRPGYKRFTDRSDSHKHLTTSG